MSNGTRIPSLDKVLARSASKGFIPNHKRETSAPREQVRDLFTRLRFVLVLAILPE